MIILSILNMFSSSLACERADLFSVKDDVDPSFLSNYVP